MVYVRLNCPSPSVHVWYTGCTQRARVEVAGHAQRVCLARFPSCPFPFNPFPPRAPWAGLFPSSHRHARTAPCPAQVQCSAAARARGEHAESSRARACIRGPCHRATQRTTVQPSFSCSQIAPTDDHLQGVCPSVSCPTRRRRRLWRRQATASDRAAHTRHSARLAAAFYLLSTPVHRLRETHPYLYTHKDPRVHRGDCFWSLSRCLAFCTGSFHVSSAGYIT